jgi:hypothetical protein
MTYLDDDDRVTVASHDVDFESPEPDVRGDDRDSARGKIRGDGDFGGAP